MKNIVVLFVVCFFSVGLHSVSAATSTIKIYTADDGFNQLYDNERETEWSSARAHAFPTLLKLPTNATGTTLTVRSDSNSNRFRIYRGSMSFDTSVIPDSADIQSASINVFKEIEGNNNGDTSLVFTTHTRISTSTLNKEDWLLSAYGDELARGLMATGTYSSFGFNTTGEAYINKEDFTIFGVMTEFDYDDVPQGFSPKAASFYSSEASGTSTDPYLEVTYVDGGATSTIQIYPTDDGFNQLYDNENQTVWSAARNYVFPPELQKPIASTTDNVTVRSDSQSDYFRIYRASLNFDTSIIPNNAEIQSAVLNVYKYAPGNNVGDTEIVFTEHTRATSSLTKEDWSLSHYGEEISRGLLSDSQYTSYTFNANGKQYINLSGQTVIGAMTEFDYDDVPQGFSPKAASFYSSEASGTSTDPYLEVTYLNYEE